MNKNNNKMDLLGNAPVPQALMALGIPIMIGMLINALYNLVDAYFIGGLGESQMGAISIAFPLGQVVVGLGLMFGNGAASYLSRLLGRGDREAASKVASTALYSSVCIGAVIIIGTAIFLKPILTMLGATDTIMPYALSYGRIYVISCIFNVFNVTMNNIVASEGAAKTTMCALLLGAVLNIGLDPIFIYTLDMGVAGAAIATAISQMASTLVYLIYALQKKSAFTFSIKEFCPSKQIITEILKIGIPTLTFQLLTSLQKVVEEGVMLELKNKDERALKICMNKYYRYVVYIVENIIGSALPYEDKEEVVSNVFVALWNYSADLDTDNYSTFKPYLGTIARNMAKNALRKTSKMHFENYEDAFQVGTNILNTGR